jgi:beta-glucanase (GH16 family)
MKYLFILITYFFAVSCLNEKPEEFSNNLVWEDNFKGSSLDTNFWNTYKGNGCPELCGFGNHELQYYSGNSSSLKVENGKLIITAFYDSLSKTFQSAKITTNKKIDFNTGYLEINAKLPNAVGTWPAIWLLPSLDRNLNWPLDGEIDIMENIGYDSCKILGTIHTKAYNHTIGTQKSDSIYINTAHQEFHTYSINWTDSILEWYVDAKLYNSIKRFPNDRIEQWPFDKSFHLILNQAVGGDWGGRFGVDTVSFPQDFIIESVRLFREMPKKSS